MTRAEEVSTQLDIADLHFQGVDGVIAAFLIKSEMEIGLIETGPTTTLPALLEAINRSGGLERLTSVVVTHIHLDHAGAAGELLKRARNATLYVHPRGAKHLAEPEALLASASRIYGDSMDPLWGHVSAVPTERMVSVQDDDVISIGGRDLRVLYTPGHASHHIALHDAERKAIFTGDAAGVRLQGSSHVRPPTPPPDIDVELWRESMERMKSLHPETLYVTHYGPHSGDVDHHFSLLIERLEAWTQLVRTGIEKGMKTGSIVDSLQREGNAELLQEAGTDQNAHRLDLASPYGMTVDGLVRYLTKSEGLTAHA